MDKDTLIGVGLGLLVGYLLWRRRSGLLAGGMAGGCGGGCAGCAGATSSIGTAAGAAPGSCARAVSAGTGGQNYTQQTGPTLQGWGSR